MTDKKKCMSMDAQSSSVRYLWYVGVLVPLLLSAMGASYETANFIVHAPTTDSAKQFAETAEQCRKDLAILWLGKTLPDWSAACPIAVHVGDEMMPGGSTSFVLENGEVFGWDMDVQGTHERILDTVLPHEISHMILASHFQTNFHTPVPRWLDEGMATTVEHKSEKAHYRRMLRHFLKPNIQRCFPLNRMVALKEYPDDPMPFYAQGFSVVEYLLESGRQFDEYEHHRLVRFVQSVVQDGDWQFALQEHYGISNLGELQLKWVKWVDSEAPALPMIAEAMGVHSLEDPAVENEMAPRTSVVSTSARPLSKSVYDRKGETIPTEWTDKKPEPIPTSFGRDVVLR